MELGEIDNPSQLVRQALAHDSALQMGLTLTYDDLTQREYVALEMLHEEREKFKANQQRRDSSMAEARAENKPLVF